MNPTFAAVAHRRLFAAVRLLALLALPLAWQAPAQAANPRVVLETSLGNITIELDAAKAPKSTANFLDYVKSGFYNGTVFHRVIAGFMIQGGGMTPDLQQKPTRAPIVNEGDNGLKNLRGTIAMARTNMPDSATSQFFINVVDNAALDYPGRDGHGYAVFGRVVEGMDVVDKIRGVETGSAQMYQDVPKTPVVIKAARLAG
jgi:cyclophilin family peptidyl-prolyl cis-trans isomerase